MFVLVVDGYEEQHEKRQHANGHGGRQCFGPEHRVDDRRRHGLGGMVMVIVVMVIVIVVMVVSVAQTEFRQSEEHKREYQRPANVLDAFLRQHGYVSADSPDNFGLSDTDRPNKSYKKQREEQQRQQ